MKDAKEFVQNTNQSFWDEYSNGHQVWGFTEFGFRCDNWEAFYRAIYTCPLYEGQQMLLDFARPENVILTNIGINDDVLQHCSEERKKYWLDPKVIIESHHQRGADELPHRGFKDFGFEELPFKRLSRKQLIKEAARAIAGGKIIGWFQGREEWGPGALGNRSILCNPAVPDMKATLNARIKNREPFRPFAPVIREEDLSTCFEGSHPVPFMIVVYKVRPEWRAKLPAITHEDNTGRVQTVRRAK